MNRDALCIGRLAFEAFGGARYTTAARLRHRHIQWEDQGIEMPGYLHKSGERHFVQGWPANLWAWMKHAPDACWDLSARQYADLKREAFVRAGFKPPEPSPEEKHEWTREQLAAFEAMRNVLRHSFGTYHLAAYRKPSETLELMTKTSLRSLNRDYRGRATQASALEYFSIMP